MPSRVIRLLVVAVLTLTAVATAQKKEKVDSLLVVIPGPKSVVMDQVLTAFAGAGLDVTDNSGSVVESDQGGTNNAWTGHKYDRVVRALVTSRDSSVTQVLITGLEVREGATGIKFKKLRIDSKAGGAGGQLWCQMVSVAMALDSLQVPESAMNVEKCRKK